MSFFCRRAWPLQFAVQEKMSTHRMEGKRGKRGRAQASAITSRRQDPSNPQRSPNQALFTTLSDTFQDSLLNGGRCASGQQWQFHVLMNQAPSEAALSLNPYGHLCSLPFDHSNFGRNLTCQCRFMFCFMSGPHPAFTFARGTDVFWTGNAEAS